MNNRKITVVINTFKSEDIITSCLNSIDKEIKVLIIENGNSLDEVYDTLNEAKNNSKNGKPIVILMKTIMGNGVDFMMHSHKWHGVAPNDEQLKEALNQNPETLGDY